MDEIRMKIEVREDETRLGPGRLIGTLMQYGQQGFRSSGGFRDRQFVLAGRWGSD